MEAWNYANLWESVAAAAPDRPALIQGPRVVSYRDFDRRANALARRMLEAGVSHQSKVGAYLYNAPEYLESYFAAFKAGLAPFNINYRYGGEELTYLLDNADAEVVVFHASFAETANKVRPNLPKVKLWLAVPEPGVAIPDWAEDYEAVAAAGADRVVAPWGRSGDDIIMMYTGGTTGMPKGCMHTQRNMLYTGAVMSSISADIGPQDVVVNFWPVFWVAGEDVAILLTVTTGATCVLMARWDPVGFVEAVQRHRASVAFMLVDNAVQVMELPALAGGNTALRSLRQTLVASFVKKLNVDFRRRWHELTGAVLREAAWGMTETHSFDTVTRGWQDDNRDLLGRQVFCGLPVPGTEFKILEFGSRRLLSLGEEGELCVRSPSLLRGYWQREEASAEAIEDGWLRTGDLGMIDTDGCLYFFGRRKEMLKVKGMSVFPAEIEAVLGQHPAVTGSGVIGREDETRGQVPVAFLTVGDGSADTEAVAADIAAFCRQRLAVYKIPEIRIVPALPMTATGKVRKNELAEWL